MPTTKKIDKAVATLIGQLQEAHGASSVMLARDMPVRGAITSGTLALDHAIGIGGFPRDRLMEIAGAEGTGKTTLAILAMANSLDAHPDRAALILDFEHKLDRDWIRTLIGEERESRVLLTWPTYAEEGTNLYADAVGGNEKKKIAAGQICFAIWDSIAAAPTARRNEDYEVGSFGGNTLAIKDFANLAAALSHKHACCTVGINQIRDDISGYHQHKVPGGHAWLHAVALRLLTKKGKGKAFHPDDKDFQVGFEVACKVVKSSLAPPGRTASWWFYNVLTDKYGFGVDTMEETVRLGVLTGVIDRRGGWYHHRLLPLNRGEPRILGRDRLIEHLRTDTATQKAIGVDVMERLRTGDFTDVVAPASPPDSDIPNGYTNLLTQSEFPEEVADQVGEELLAKLPGHTDVDTVVEGLMKKFIADGNGGGGDLTSMNEEVGIYHD